MPKGFYDVQFSRTVKKTGRWRGKLSSVYKKYKRIKVIKPQPEIINGKIVIPDNCFKPVVLIWNKIQYQSKLN